MLVGSVLGLAALAFGVYKLLQARKKAHATLLSNDEAPPSKRKKRSVAQERQGAFSNVVKRMRTLRHVGGTDYLAYEPSPCGSLARSSTGRARGSTAGNSGSGSGTSRGRASRGKSMKTTDTLALTAASGSVTMRRGGRIPAFEEARLR